MEDKNPRHLKGKEKKYLKKNKKNKQNKPRQTNATPRHQNPDINKKYINKKLVFVYVTWRQTHNTADVLEHWLELQTAFVSKCPQNKTGLFKKVNSKNWPELCY